MNATEAAVQKRYRVSLEIKEETPSDSNYIVYEEP